ncbi:putative Transmembrane protease serine 9 [Hypsibius exemplaris]|uniref:Transmembrane protease serine 9 n=1 Tax=Hypsibius exemplaris TaxID=2072580 RepID=A0A9X6NIR3_HYPEX|nr:putative Transmembrane protease serine 9 [Hypsibius exemplaris]
MIMSGLGIRRTRLLAVVVTFCISWTSATTVDFKNLCDYPIDLVKTVYGRQPVTECELNASGGSCSKSYNGGAMNFKNRRDDQNVTLAVFIINFRERDAVDAYAINVMSGYNVPLQIATSTGGPSVKCTDAECRDGMHLINDNSKVHETKTGGTFTLTFCPKDEALASRLRFAKQSIRKILTAGRNYQSKLPARKTVWKGILHRFRLTLDFDLETVPVRQALATTETCGIPSPLKPSDIPNKLKIVNGAVVPDGTQPWACAMVWGDWKPKQFCDCTVIDEQWVVTASHCVFDVSEATMKTYVKIYMGITDLRRAVAPQNIFGISRVIRHPQYSPRTFDFDVALIKLARPIPAFSSTLMPACLPTAPINATAVETGAYGRRICYITGWGTLGAGERGNATIGSGSDVLLQAAIEMFNSTACRNDLPPNSFTSNMVCGGYDAGGYDSCQGDSGGPLVCDAGDGTWTLNGIVSWGEGCAYANKPGVYSNVYELLPFITSTMAQN